MQCDEKDIEHPVCFSHESLTPIRGTIPPLNPLRTKLIFNIAFFTYLKPYSNF